jgi:hypothetical protein
MDYEGVERRRAWPAIARCLWASLALLEQAVAREKVAAMKMAVARENRAETTEMAVTKAETTMEMAVTKAATTMEISKAKTTSMNSFVTHSSTVCSCSRVNPSADEAALAYPAVAEEAVRRLEVLRQLDVELQAEVSVEEVQVQGVLVADEGMLLAEVSVEEVQMQGVVFAEEGLLLAVEAVMITEMQAVMIREMKTVMIRPMDMSMLQARAVS